MHILVMQSNRRLIKNVENLAATPSGQLGREFNSLGFPSLECRCRLSKLNISESDFAQDFQTIMDLRNIAKKFVRIINRHRKHIKNIFDVLSMTIDDADEFFRDIPQIHDRLKVLREVGLGYIELGQSATTLSGGEAQRVKLATELAGRRRGRILYILDEPTVGLHYEDVRKLIEVLQRLVGAGNTVLVIEHNLDVIKCADYLIDLGPEGGDKGGEVVAQGTPEEVARVKGSDRKSV